MRKYQVTLIDVNNKPLLTHYLMASSDTEANEKAASLVKFCLNKQVVKSKIKPLTI